MSHPPAGRLAGESPSIASLVSNSDLNATSFIGQARSQGQRIEIITEMEALVKNALRSYMSNPQKIKPQAIIYYRDGVGEGQFEEIKRVELTAIKNACQALGLQAQVTIVICQKSTDK